MGKDRDVKNKQTNDALREEIKQLTRIIQSSQSGSKNNEAVLKTIMQQQEAIVTEREHLKHQISQLMHENTMLQQQVLLVQQNHEQTMKEVNILRTQTSSKMKEAQNEVKARERAELEAKELKNQYDTASTTVHEMGKKQHELELLIIKLERDATLAQQTVKKSDEVIAQITRQRNDLDEKLREQYKINAEMLADLDKMQVQQAFQEQEIGKLKNEKMELNKIYELVQHRRKKSEEEKKELQYDRNQLQQELSKLGKNMEHVLKSKKETDTKIAQLNYQKSVLTKAYVKAEFDVDLYKDHSEKQSQSAKKVEKSNMALKEDLHELKQLVITLERQKDEYSVRTGEAELQSQAALDELKVQEGIIHDLEHQITDLKEKLVHLEGMYNTARKERNMYDRQVTQMTDDVFEHQQQASLYKEHVDQLKSETQEQESVIKTAHEKYEKLFEQKASLYNKCVSLKKKKTELLETMQNMQHQLQKQEHVLHFAEQEKKALEVQIEDLVKQRETLGAHIVRRNDQIVLLQEKVRIQDTILANGTHQYSQKVLEINQLKLKLKDYARTISAWAQRLKVIVHLRHENHALNCKLEREQRKSQALAEELGNPTNVHRWRTAEAKEFPEYELQCKAQALQKLLIHKANTIIHNELTIKKQAEMIEQLQYQASQFKCRTEIPVLHDKLRAKKEKMKSILGELQTYKTLLQEEQVHNEDLQYKLYCRDKYAAKHKSGAKTFRNHAKSLPLIQPKFNLK